jgi:hypothetical protein
VQDATRPPGFLRILTFVILGKLDVLTALIQLNSAARDIAQYVDGITLKLASPPSWMAAPTTQVKETNHQ